MRKGTVFIVSILIVGLLVAPTAWGFKWPWQKDPAIKIGINAPITGDIPKVGEGSKFAAQMWLEDINAAGGLDVGEKNTKLNWPSRTTSQRPNRPSKP